jgi:hypothetical protein
MPTEIELRAKLTTLLTTAKAATSRHDQALRALERLEQRIGTTWDIFYASVGDSARQASLTQELRGLQQQRNQALADYQPTVAPMESAEHDVDAAVGHLIERHCLEMRDRAAALRAEAAAIDQVAFSPHRSFWDQARERLRADPGAAIEPVVSTESPWTRSAAG